MRTLRSGAAAPVPVRTLVCGLALHLLALCSHMRAKQRSRRQLSLLDDRLLRDIGVDRLSAQQEAARLPWE